MCGAARITQDALSAAAQYMLFEYKKLSHSGV
jgi:hypothetical protein